MFFRKVWIQLKAWRKLTVIILALILAFVFFFNSISFPLFNSSYSTVLEDEKGELLAARIAEDGQWRFPYSGQIPVKFEKALLSFEDKNFYNHYGVDFPAIFNAAYQNIKAREIVRGGSTLTMQVIRLSGKNKKRTYLRKLLECIQALRLESKLNKKEILTAYSSEAPFGGNVVGIEAASWRYFGQSPERLSWAEAATLAVLPNSPSLIFPGKNQLRLKKKRDALLLKMRDKGIITTEEFHLAVSEPVPGKPHPLPIIAPHLLAYCERLGAKGKRNNATIKSSLQKKVNRILGIHHDKLSGNGIYNAAALILDVESGKVLAYAGNVLSDSRGHGYDVDIIQAERSTGSILKPLLFAMILNDGKLLSTALVPDIPTLIGGYAPRNYYLSYDGAVKLQQSVSRSLNVPAVRQLLDYGVEKFHLNLQKLGITSLHHSAKHYGLSIILGGAEGTLWDLASVYRNLSYSLNHFPVNSSIKVLVNNTRPVYLQQQLKQKMQKGEVCIDPASVWLMMEAMNEVSRPEEEASWKDYASAYKIAWKTGTSFGYRDGWAIGCTPQHIVAVWVGNADGEGRPELTGISTAAPIMFDIFKLLKSPSWFVRPFSFMEEAVVCAKSGYKASEYCEEGYTASIQKSGLNSSLCPYHKIVFLDETEKYRVNGECESVAKMKAKKWFVLPPAMEHYYKRKNSAYKVLPPYRPDCRAALTLRSMEIIYPQKGSRIFVPIQLDGNPGKTVFEVAHRSPESHVFWYLDNYYIGSTRDYHQMALNPEAGEHRLTVTDETGESRDVTFNVISDREGRE